MKKFAMDAWIRDLSLKYKFWAVNLVAFFTTLLLVLFAMQQEQAGRADAAREAAQARAQLLAAWPADVPLPRDAQLLPFPASGQPPLGLSSSARGWTELEHDALWGDSPVIGAWVQEVAGQRVAVTA